MGRVQGNSQSKRLTIEEYLALSENQRKAYYKNLTPIMKTRLNHELYKYWGEQNSKLGKISEAMKDT